MAFADRYGKDHRLRAVVGIVMRDICLRYGVVPAIDPVVDLYNAISLRYAVPVGGENGGSSSRACRKCRRPHYVRQATN